jgi:putative membrane-bound dehydrogenase-like protein
MSTLRPGLYLLAVALLAAPAVGRAEGRAIVEGPHAMASTPALPADVAARRFSAPPGFEVRLFAAEPQVVNPVAMTWDERGRLWVVELFQYPHKAPPGQKGRDRIKIYEDTDNDGRADKVSVFADDLNLATGIARYRNGVLVGQAPELLFLEDTNGDDRADRRTVMLTGFSIEDTHELVNGFAWGPDGWLYMTHGVFNDSKVKNPDVDEDGVEMNAALARFHPGWRKFEIFADGTSNPWGVDFDRHGNAFVSACVIDHLFHLVPGGVYERQAGTPGDPYAYELLPSIVDFKHYRAAYAGVQIYQGDQYPAAYRDMIVFGNIHANAVNRDRLTPQGASFKAAPEADFVKSQDPWFRPVSELVGPDGNLWIADWYDRYPCYQNAMADPEGVDRKLGRIWRVVHTGDKPGAVRGSVRGGQRDLAKATSRELVALLSDANVWHRRVAQRLLGERRDARVKAPLVALAQAGSSLDARLAALWTLHGAGHLDDQVLASLAGDKEPALRAWVARLDGERDADDTDGTRALAALPRLAALARDADPTVRAGVAVALRRMVGRDTDAALSALLAGGADRVLQFLVWRALEPRVARDARPLLSWMKAHGATALPLSAEILRRTLRRLYDTGDPKRIDQAVAFVGDIAGDDARLVTAGLDGLLEGQMSQSYKPAGTRAVRALMRRTEPEVVELARRVGAIWGDPAATKAVLALIGSEDAKVTDKQRLSAIDIAGRMKGAASVRSLLAALGNPKRPQVRVAAVRALGKLGARGTDAAILRSWKSLTPELRAASTDVLASRPAWALSLLTAVERKKVPDGDVPVSVRRVLERSEDSKVRERIAAVFGRRRESSSEVHALIAEKKRVMLQGPVDFANGREQATKLCLLCHKFFGEGGDVGPDLTGVGRATLDALLTNVIDPNQVIGKGYEQITVSTKDGRTISGRMTEDTPERVTVVGLNLRETVPRSAIESVHVSDVSVMPEGLENLPDADLRDLLWYIYQPPEDTTSRLRVELAEKSLRVKARGPGQKGWNELLTYVMDPALRPYIHPLRDPSGVHVLTDDRPADHVWQHGVFTGMHAVNGMDFWTELEGRQRFARLLDLQQETDRILWKALVEWVAPSGEVVLQEEQAITVYAPEGPGGYAIDFDWTLQTQQKAVTFGKYDYGGLSVRMPVHPGHTHLNSTGQTHKDTNTRRAAWTSVERPFDKGGVWGVAVMDHPGNERHPAAWRVDGHGLISPSPSIQGPWSIPEFASQKRRYRVVVFKGPAAAARLDRSFEAFSAVPFFAGR